MSYGITKSSRWPGLSVLGALLVMIVALLGFQAPAQAGSCTARAGTRTDPSTGWSWNTLWYCGNAAGAPMYRTPSKSQPPVVVMNSTTSWFVCYARGDIHNGNNNVWYYSLGDVPAGVWGYMPAETVWTDTDPWPGVPQCPTTPPTSNVGKVQGDPVAIANADGRLEVFAIGWDNAAWHIWQTAPGGGWSQWESLGGWADQLSVTRNRDGRLELFVRGSDRAVHNRSQITPGNSVFYPWGHLGGNVLRIAAAQNLDGRLEVFALTSSNVLQHIWQNSPGGAWSGWGSLGGWGDQLAVSRNNDGRLEVFVRGSDRALHHRSQTSPGGSWYDWGHRGGTIDQIAVTQNAYGELEVFTIGSDHAIWHNWQVSPGSGTWSGWGSLGGWLDRIYASQQSNGRLHIFGRSSDSALWHNFQPSLTAWSGWAYEGGGINQPVVERNTDGRLEVFTRGTDNRVFHKSQFSAGGAWSGWTAFPSLTPPAARCWADPPDWFGHKDGPGGERSDPINVIVCFQNGRTWNAMFTELAKIKEKRIFSIISADVSFLVGFEEVLDPVQLPVVDGHCISSVYADVQSGAVDQTFSAREGGCSADAILAPGINHFRVWPQASSGARFLTVSTESPCVETHCVVSYDQGRGALIEKMTRAVTNAGWPAPDVRTIGAVPAGAITQPYDWAGVPPAPYDGNVTIITFR
jgi:hypothetical protein